MSSPIEGRGGGGVEGGGRTAGCGRGMDTVRLQGLRSDLEGRRDTVARNGMVQGQGHPRMRRRGGWCRGDGVEGIE